MADDAPIRIVLDVPGGPWTVCYHDAASYSAALDTIVRMENPRVSDYRLGEDWAAYRTEPEADTPVYVEGK